MVATTEEVERRNIMSRQQTQHASNELGATKSNLLPAAEGAEEEAGECGKRIVDHKMTLLAAAMAAMSIEGEPCLDEILPGLKSAGISKSDIRWGMENGRFPVACAEVGARALEKVCEEAQERHNERT
ncbi:MAG: hypothetical protein C4532_19170 [Candidatus Abyssobacteria bacterium SURF_17]|uniref:Uncharacterized protein n=1 Tax=Candidatus Abyssobacteria bacterium SURF_17 TaxID=2093361 RepID=A0A419ENX6_9BACT|nr:MAG: hypothetical protein C4532_19170 [Candidatus Abyssubacteria bacterium SURF_17]